MMRPFKIILRENVMKKISLRILFLFVATFISANVFANTAPTIYQAGMLLNLSSQIYEGSESLENLTKHGGFGLGTVNGARGEMVILDHKAYLGNPDGKAEAISLQTKTPFAMVIDFKPTETFTLKQIHNMEELKKSLDKKMPNANIFYVIKIEANFSRVVMRDVEPPVKPYIPIDQWIAKHQHIFDLRNIPGTMVVFRSPDYMNPLTIVGYHFHFINADRNLVGHVYDLAFDQAKISVEPVTNYLLMLTETADFSKAKLQVFSKERVGRAENR